MSRILRYSCAASIGALALLFVQLTTGPKLIGAGCGPDREIMWADEEDEFPNCISIEQWRAF